MYLLYAHHTHIMSPVSSSDVIVLPDCESYNCQNGGTCMFVDNEPYCVCGLDYGGQYCQTGDTHTASGMRHIMWQTVATTRTFSLRNLAIVSHEGASVTK